jgi:hypothetical protein
VLQGFFVFMTKYFCRGGMALAKSTPNMEPHFRAISPNAPTNGETTGKQGPHVLPG